jgi:GNAT superfamily N-acetyltransferase
MRNSDLKYGRMKMRDRAWISGCNDSEQSEVLIYTGGILMEIVYKKLTETELETFIDMRIRQLTEEYVSEGRSVPENVDLKSALFDFYHRHMADGTFVSWLAMDGDKIVGTSGMSFVEKPPYFTCPSGKLGLLSSMFTDPDYRRMGIAKELLHRVVEEARAYGCGAVHITASNMGVKLYTAYGFKHNGNFMQYTL